MMEESVKRERVKKEKGEERERGMRLQQGWSYAMRCEIGRWNSNRAYGDRTGRCAA